jgi:hypothetical protein
MIVNDQYPNVERVDLYWFSSASKFPIEATKYEIIRDRMKPSTPSAFEHRSACRRGTQITHPKVEFREFGKRKVSCIVNEIYDSEMINLFSHL